MSERIGTIGLVISTATLVLASEFSSEVARQVVGGIASENDERVMYLVFVEPTSINSLMASNN